MKIINFAHGALPHGRRLCRAGRHPARPAGHRGAVRRLRRRRSCSACRRLSRLIVRPLYSRPLDAILATWGLGIVIGQVITLVFGREVQFVPSPVSGTVDVPRRGLFRLSPVDGAGRRSSSASCSRRCSCGTRLGLSTRAVIMNENLARGLGIDSGLVRFVTFGIGAALAALAGALITPLSSVDPNMGLAVAGQRLHAGDGVGRVAADASARLSRPRRRCRCWSAPSSARSSAA